MASPVLNSYRNKLKNQENFRTTFLSSLTERIEKHDKGFALRLSEDKKRVYVSFCDLSVSLEFKFRGEETAPCEIFYSEKSITPLLGMLDGGTSILQSWDGGHTEYNMTELSDLIVKEIENQSSGKGNG